jgi:hypothetical protein
VKRISANYAGIVHDDIIACLAYARDAPVRKRSSPARAVSRQMKTFLAQPSPALEAAAHDIVWINNRSPGHR